MSNMDWFVLVFFVVLAGLMLWLFDVYDKYTSREVS